MKTQSHTESGSILFWLFIAVALFAALGFAVANINRGGGNSSLGELSKMKATDIMQYTSAIQRSIRIMRIENVDETALCFHTVQWGHTNYEFNPQCTEDRNRVFHPAGGAIGFQENVSDWYDSGISLAEGGEWIFSARYEVANVGTDGGTANSEDGSVDLLIITAPLIDTVCEGINKLLGYNPATPPAVPATTYNDLRTNKFTGTYVGENGSRIGDLGRERCVTVPDSPAFNMYYKVILAR
ncbi:MAG: hypothetical protein CO093_01865 [Alphaproteobacteria bacterium CG_4_9_14_3_um_filter_47_13]|nr:MAG: hypothetical protein CO093_01865 [Alphaproteobacteria bacterium CG_4_9_14_3_um_filter_47_13]